MTGGECPLRRDLPRPIAYLHDEGGQALRHYVIAVAAGTLAAVVICTLLAERVYDGMKHTFGH